MKMAFCGIAAVTVLSFFAAPFLLTQANAATITVTSTADAGAGSLRQTIVDAAASDTIDFDPTTFPSASPATITLTSALPTINKPLTIDGNGGVIINANSTGRIFLVDDGTGSTITVLMDDLVLSNG
ncbi:MAG: hypothetical protein ACYC9M_10545 [Desulfobulbaceae bacterium]